MSSNSAAASLMVKVMHQFMVKSSAGVFRARFVVPLFDWPAILEADGHNYDSLSATVGDSDARTRFGAGVFVTELAGQRTSNRLLCVTACTSTVFINVLHRLLSGFAGGREEVTIRVLVAQTDFELAAANNGRSGTESMLIYLQHHTAVRINENFERFTVYPLSDETALRIVGRPSAVVQCICLINEILCGTTTVAVARLVDADRQMLRIDTDHHWSEYMPEFNRSTNPTRSALFDSSSDQDSPSSPTETGHWPVSGPRPLRSPDPYWSNFERLLAYYSMESPSETTVNRPVLDVRFPSPIRNISRRPVDPRLSNRVDTRTRTSFHLGPRGWPVRNRHPLPSEVATNRTMNRNRTPRIYTPDIRPSSSVQSIPDQLVNRDPSSRVTNATTSTGLSSDISIPVTTNNTTATKRHATPYPDPPDQLNINRQSSSSTHVNANANTTTNRTATPYPRASNQLSMSQQRSSLHVTTIATTGITSTTTVQSSDIRISGSVTTNNTTATKRHAVPYPSPSDQLNTNRQSTPRVTTNANTTTNRTATPYPSASNQFSMSQQRSSLHVTTIATTAITSTTTGQSSDNRISGSVTTNNTTATKRHAVPHPRPSGQRNTNRQSTPRVTTNANTTTNRTATPYPSPPVKHNNSRQSSSAPPITTNAKTTTPSCSDSYKTVNCMNPSSCVTPTTTASATTSTTNLNINPNQSVSEQVRLCRQLSSCAVTNANTGTNRRQSTRSRSERFELSRNSTARISPSNRRSTRCMRSLEYLNINRRLSLSRAIINANIVSNRHVTSNRNNRIPSSASSATSTTATSITSTSTNTTSTTATSTTATSTTATSTSTTATTTTATATAITSTATTSTTTASTTNTSTITTSSTTTSTASMGLFSKNGQI